jgi:pSer/pThr/pTyr-binding forkhead associated (FHA) protein
MADKRFILKKLPDGPEIPLAGELCVGRSPESGLKLVEGRPSRNHALLSISEGSVFVEDLGSTNGTFVNDRRIDSKVRLKSNDKLRFDVEQYLFLIDSGSPADRTVLREGAPDVVAASGKARVPEGWLENPQAGNKTLYMSPEQLRQERKRLAAMGAVDGAMGRVEVPQLVVLGGPEGPLRIQLQPTQSGKKEWAVGCEGEREILLARVGVSALHAKIVNEGNRWKVIDELSANGTFVNGRRCTMSFLSSADRITFGSVECIFQLPKGAQAAAARDGQPRNWKKLAMAVGALLVIAAVLWFFLAH